MSVLDNTDLVVLVILRFRTLLWILLLALPGPVRATNIDTVLDRLARVNAEIEVRRFHLKNTTENDKSKTKKKLTLLEHKQSGLIREKQNAVKKKISDELKLLKTAAVESYSFSEKDAHQCLVDEDFDVCRMRGIRVILFNISNMFSEYGVLENQFPQNIYDEGSISLSGGYLLSYSTEYEASFTQEGLVSYELAVTGTLEKHPSSADLTKLEDQLTLDTNRDTENRLRDLTSHYREQFMSEESLIEKSKKKRRLIGSF